MKRMNYLVGLVLAMAMATSVSGQTQSGKNLPCLNGISNLTADQQKQIGELEQTYQTQMEAFRKERRSTSSLEEKQQVYEKMQKAKGTHRTQVLNVLDEGQKQEYLALQGNGKRQFQANRNGRNRPCNGVRGNRRGNGQGNFKGKGGGNCQAVGRGQGRSGRNSNW
ncbi:hypothetical protein [uncultured Sunxiuqinia sp.]|uniref:hypothetical protein n=1 Tax=uncultured Sunxiuqinia sp. TaxID=1573825 RepID=UPI00260CABFD|nr:hypothetical protein [uncultured Sunxiuqinia sp.]